MMDLKRFDEIDGLDVLKSLSKEESIYNTQGNELYIDDCKMWMSNGELNGVVNITIADILSGKWFIKKPFDIRSEMLARPNEWVGAFKNRFGDWVKVGFSTQTMSPRQTNTSLESGFSREETVLSMPEEFSNCIPIEDVPKEELQ